MIFLGDIELDLDRNIRDDGQFQAFLRRGDVAALGWPEDVVRQWLWEFGDRDAFVDDYGAIDLDTLRWDCEELDAAVFDTIPTGPRDGDCIDRYAGEHGYWMEAKSRHRPEVRTAWEERGTWVVPPVLIDRSLLDPAGPGLQVVEGRTRVGVLRGRRRDGLSTAPFHRAWVGRRELPG